MRILSKHTSGVHVLSSPNHLNGNEPTTPDIMERIVVLMKTMFDFIIVDGGQALDDNALKIIEMTDDLLLVSILSLPCLSNTSKVFRSFKNLGLLEEDHIRIVVNRCMKSSEISLKDAEQALNKKIFWTIPNDYKTAMSAINQGRVLSQIAPKAAITKNMRQMVQALVNAEGKKNRKHWKFLRRA
jgi:pilus assembly protein CpaE